MAIVPKEGFMIDPNNPNAVIPIGSEPLTTLGSILPVETQEEAEARIALQ